jgi:hypothetical protein
MTHLSNEQIEDAFARIRAEFEKRNNETGLEILDSFEEQWNAGEGLSDRQIAWLEKQLDGTWRAVGTKSVPDAGHCQTKILAIFHSLISCGKLQVFCAVHRQPGITIST